MIKRPGAILSIEVTQLILKLKFVCLSADPVISRMGLSSFMQASKYSIVLWLGFSTSSRLSYFRKLEQAKIGYEIVLTKYVDKNWLTESGRGENDRRLHY